MKIALFVENYFPYVCGVNISVRNLKKALELNGHEVYIVTFRLHDVDYSKMDTSHLILLPAHRIAGKRGEELCLYYNFAIHDCVKLLEPYQFDLVHINEEFTSSKIALAYASEHHIPAVYTCHTMWDVYIKTVYTWIREFMSVAMKQLFLNAPIKYCHEVVVPSEKTLEAMDKSYHNDFTVLPTVLDPDEFMLSQEDQREVLKLKEKYHLQGRKVILYLGRVSEEKRIEDVARFSKSSFIKHPELFFLIAGGGPYLETCKKNLAEILSPDQYLFIGPVSPEERRLYYALGDIFSTASDFETQGLTYTEAVFAHLPLLVKADPVLKGVVEDKVTGFTFQDEKSFAASLDYMLTHDLTKVKEEAFRRETAYGLLDWGKDMLSVYEKAEAYQQAANDIRAEK